MTRPQIRLARPTDAEVIAALSRDTIEVGLPWRWVESRVRHCIADPDHNVVVAELSEENSGAPRFAGFGVMQFLDEHAHLSLLAVTPDLQGLRVGGAVLAWLMRCAEVAGAATVKLELKSNNERARRFYERAQFREIGLKAGGYYGLADQRVMERRLRFVHVSAA
jgi:[ribosomal protein S18]-alanine N-acetyltransferase